MNGRIVILNGAPRSGKSSIAKAMQEHLPGRWINLGVDAQNRSLPDVQARADRIPASGNTAFVICARAC